MKLIKIKEDYFIVVDDSEIKEGDWYYHPNNSIDQYGKREIEFMGIEEKKACKKITHSTEPLVPIKQLIEKGYDTILPIDIDEVKELIGEVDVEKKATKFARNHGMMSYISPEKKEGFLSGYNQALEDNKGKRYTEEQVREIWKAGQEYWKTSGASITFEELTERMSNQPKTEWEVEIVNGKLSIAV